MEDLLKTTKEEKVVVETTTDINQEALKDIAIELLKGNVKLIGWEAEHSSPYSFSSLFIETTTTIELIVGDGYKVTIENTKVGR